MYSSQQILLSWPRDGDDHLSLPPRFHSYSSFCTGCFFANGLNYSRISEEVLFTKIKRCRHYAPKISMERFFSVANFQYPYHYNFPTNCHYTSILNKFKVYTVNFIQIRLSRQVDTLGFQHLQVVPGSQMVMAADFAKRRKKQLIDAAKRTLDFFCAMAIGMASLPAMARCSQISGTKQPKRQR